MFGRPYQRGDVVMGPDGCAAIVLGGELPGRPVLWCVSAAGEHGPAFRGFPAHDVRLLLRARTVEG